MNPIIQTIIEIFDARGDEKYGEEAVTQRQHALQCGLLAEEADAPGELIVAALLHDLGHIMSEEQLPEGLDEDLHDFHEERGYQWLLAHFGPAVADPVRLHVEAKRYLCTQDPEYAQRLSPTSLKSYYDQGGPMNEEEKKALEAAPHFRAALALRRWDDLAKDPEMKTPSIEHFVPYMELVMRT